MDILKGFYINDKDIDFIYSKFMEMESAVKDVIKSEYEFFVAREIEYFYDLIALNALERPTDISLFDLAKKNVNMKINEASIKRLHSPHNLSCHVRVLPSGDACIFEVLTINDKIFGELKKIKGLKDISVGFKEKSDNSDLWLKTIKENDGRKLLSINFFEIPDIKAEDLKFRPKSERAKEMARLNIESQIFSQIKSYSENESGMKIFDDVMSMFDTSYTKGLLKDLENNLMMELINIDLDIITKVPNTGEEKESESISV